MENREIKFRSYSEFNGKKEMLYSDMPKQNYKITPFGVFVSDSHNYQYTSYILFGKDYSIMQFTGMADENGIEIYENDIVVSYKKPYEDTPSENIVKFIDGCWRLVCKGKNDIPLYNYKPINLRIIGNIFNTPSHI